MKISYDGAQFVAHCELSEKEELESAGFKWNSLVKKLVSKNAVKAGRFRQHFDNSAEKKFKRSIIEVTPMPASRLDWPLSLTPFPHQLEMVKWAMTRNFCYWFADPGTGKTPAAVILANTLVRPIVYICPAFLVLNVAEEFRKWGQGIIAKNVSTDISKKLSWVSIVPSSMIHYGGFQGLIEQIANMFGVDPILIVDEAHEFKEYKGWNWGNGPRGSRRSIALYEKIAPLFNKVVLMSGTMMPNRPLELFAPLSNFNPEAIGFRDFEQFGKYYCDGKMKMGAWDFTGASNTKELFQKMKEKFVLRIRKQDVLKDLPKLTEELFFIGENVPGKTGRLDRKLLAEYGSSDDYWFLAPNDAVATYRKNLGMIKAEIMAPIIETLLENKNENILVFANHKEVISYLTEYLDAFKPLVITGQVPGKLRHSIAKEFQQNKKRRLMILNTRAGGIGLNLTKANRGINLEPDWSPGVNDQARDRAHRIGQKNPFLFQYVFFKNSLDRSIVGKHLDKKNLVGKI